MKWWAFLIVGLLTGILVSVIGPDTPEAILDKAVNAIALAVIPFLMFWVFIRLITERPKTWLISARDSFLLVAGYFVAAGFFRLI